MKIKKFTEINEALSPDSMRKRIEEAASNAQETFWSTMVDEFPEIETGDFPPDATFAFDKACEDAADVWVSYNISRSKGESTGI